MGKKINPNIPNTKKKKKSHKCQCSWWKKELKGSRRQIPCGRPEDSDNSAPEELYTIYQGYNEYAAKRGTTMTEKFSGGSPLNTRTSGRRNCYRTRHSEQK